MNRDKICLIAEKSAAAHYVWDDRGRAPLGYTKGMALSYANAIERHRAGVAAMLYAGRADTRDDNKDALSWYRSKFVALGLSLAPGEPTLLNLFTLMMGLGMRESSGRYCEGADRSASNRSGDTCEAGTFQTSWDIRGFVTGRHCEALLREYSEDEVDGFRETYKQGVTCKALDLKCYGSGVGLAYQRLAKAKPDFATEVTAVGLRACRKHWGPLNRRQVEIRSEAVNLFNAVHATLRETAPSPDSPPALVA